MRIISEKTFQASLDDGLTVTTFPSGIEHDVPALVGGMAVEHYGAKLISDKQNVAAKKRK